MCLVCGLKNPFGLKAWFYELENKELLAIFKPSEFFQSYPGRLHGGIATAILDETIGRAILMHKDNLWGVTVELHTRFLKPVPLNEKIRAIGRIDHIHERFFEGSGEILLKDGTVAVQANGKYVIFPLEKIADFDPESQEWKVTPSTEDPDFIEL